ncbi:hypothetical protein DFK10_13265 [Salibaculum griseiflavum]|uniref:Uncharacterized protein n=1 Tax=Salibaculum griseiflavum TaxID=1914409 RepID=A0A2V1P1F7_9RHOB|nr:hypothetical protein DFK10_13265 [Salibaculum griseiflavum]
MELHAIFEETLLSRRRSSTYGMLLDFENRALDDTSARATARRDQPCSLLGFQLVSQIAEINRS